MLLLKSYTTSTKDNLHKHVSETKTLNKTEKKYLTLATKNDTMEKIISSLHVINIPLQFPILVQIEQDLKKKKKRILYS